LSETQERHQLIGRGEKLVEIANSINRQLTTLLVRKTTADWSRRETGGDSQQHQQTAHHSTGKENHSCFVKERNWWR